MSGIIEDGTGTEPPTGRETIKKTKCLLCTGVVESGQPFYDHLEDVHMMPIRRLRIIQPENWIHGTSLDRKGLLGLIIMQELKLLLLVLLYQQIVPQLKLVLSQHREHIV